MKKKLYIILIIFILIIQFTYISFADDIDEEIIDVSSEVKTSTNLINEDLKVPDTNCRSYVVIDRNSNTILCGKKEFEKRKMASTTKIMTATIIIENFNLNDTVIVSKKAAGTGGSRLGLKVNDKISVKDLLYGLMLCSGNDAAVALAEYAAGDVQSFADLMNEKALELSLANTHFETPHGLDSDEHYTTAYELAILSNYALKNKIFSQIVSTKTYSVYINGNPKTLSNTNELLGNLNGVYGIKTGFTNGANRCLVTACKRNNIDIICVVLGADTKKDRTKDSIKLIEYVYKNFEIVNIQNIINDEFQKWKNNNLHTFTINKAITNNISLEIDNLAFSKLPIRKDLINSINIDITCQKEFDAPLYENTKIGAITLLNNKNIITKSDIYISNYIEKKTINFYVFTFFKDYLNLLFESI